MKDVTRDQLLELFKYDKVTGNLIRAKDSNNQCKAGDIVGWDRGIGYNSVKINKKTYLVHRIIWIYHYGEIQEGKCIDHINGNKKDNRIENLREVCKHENCTNRNKTDLKNLTSKYKGVHRNKKSDKSGKFYSCISFNKVKYYLGSFDDELEAYKAYLIKANELHGEFMPTKVKQDYFKYIISGEN